MSFRDRLKGGLARMLAPLLSLNDPQWGRRPGGNNQGPPDLEALRLWCREQMANFKVPRRIVLVEALPLNASGKVDKLALRARAAEGSGAAR